jgi:hypothetical protein
MRFPSTFPHLISSSNGIHPLEPWWEISAKKGEVIMQHRVRVSLIQVMGTLYLFDTAVLIGGDYMLGSSPDLRVVFPPHHIEQQHDLVSAVVVSRDAEGFSFDGSLKVRRHLLG